jgi:hypothetical protein
MSLENVDFNNLSTADLLRLKENGVTEGRHIEYKCDAMGSADPDKKEFLKASGYRRVRLALAS